MIKEINGGICAAKGFTANGIHCGIRKNKTKRDLALIHTDFRIRPITGMVRPKSNQNTNSQAKTNSACIFAPADFATQDTNPGWLYL